MADLEGTARGGYGTARDAAYAVVPQPAGADRSQSRKLVLVSVAALLAVNVYRANSEPGSLYRRLWGTGVVGVMLSLLADFAPQIAGPFALLIALGAYTRGGDQALQSVLGKVGTPLAGSATAHTAATTKASGGSSAPFGSNIFSTGGSA